MIAIKLLRLPVLPVLLVLIIAACNEPDEIGIEVQPAGDQPGVFYTDTFTVEANTIREDTLRTDEGVAAFNLAGSYTDPVFGMTSASFYTQVRLPNNNNNFTFGTSPQLDSVVLTLTYADYYGDTLTPLNMEVLEITESGLTFDSSYYSNDVFATGQSWFNGTIEAHPKDSVEIDGSKKAPHLRLHLDPALGTAFMNSGSANFVDNAAFTNYFKGFYVKVANVTSSGQGSILSFNLLASQSKFTFYYRNGSDTLAANFEINADCPRFNHYEHDYTLSTFGTNFPVSGNDAIYIQSMAGVKGRIKFPHLKNLSANGPVSINKAELVIPVENNSTYSNHNALIVFGVDSNGGEAIIPDLLESVNYYGGTFNNTDQNFKFNLARYVQRLVSGKISTDYGLSIVSASGGYNSHRSIIPGPGRPDKKIQLRLTYSRLK